MPAPHLVFPERHFDVQRVGLVEQIAAIDPLTVCPWLPRAFCDEDGLRKPVLDILDRIAGVGADHALLRIIGANDPLASDTPVVAATHSEHERAGAARRRAEVRRNDRGGGRRVGRVVVGNLVVHPVARNLFLQPGQDERAPGKAALGAASAGLPFNAADRKPSLGEQMPMQCTADLAEIVGALKPAGPLAYRLHCR